LGNTPNETFLKWEKVIGWLSEVPDEYKYHVLSSIFHFGKNMAEVKADIDPVVGDPTAEKCQRHMSDINAKYWIICLD